MLEDICFCQEKGQTVGLQSPVLAFFASVPSSFHGPAPWGLSKIPLGVSSRVPASIFTFLQVPKIPPRFRRPRSIFKEHTESECKLCFLVRKPCCKWDLGAIISSVLLKKHQEGCQAPPTQTWAMVAQKWAPKLLSCALVCRSRWTILGPGLPPLGQKETGRSSKLHGAWVQGKQD